MLDIVYDKESHKITLSISEHSFPWIEIRRLCEEKAGGFSSTSTSLELPWWEFLSIKEQLLFIFQKHRIKVNIDESTQALLRTSIAKHRAYIEGCKRNLFQNHRLLTSLQK